MTEEKIIKQRTYKQRVTQRNSPSLQLMSSEFAPGLQRGARNNVVIDCGWGRLIFGQTFTDAKTLSEILLQEKPHQRDISFYLRDPHVVLSFAPQELFLDPSHTYRLWFSSYLPGRIQPKGFRIRKIQRRTDTDAINWILKKCHMVPVDPEFIWKHRDSTTLTYVVAEDPKTQMILGTVMGVDHRAAFRDPENGSSLWCLAVDPQALYPGIGHALVAYIADYYTTRGCGYLDLSVMHDNQEAIKLYEKMGFTRVPVFCIKRKNPINERLFVGPTASEKMNPYVEIITDEARRRGIAVNVIDAKKGYFKLNFGGRSIMCHESLSELTNAVAMSCVANKVVTRRMLKKAGLNVPDQVIAGTEEENRSFLEKQDRVVVKPSDSEQGKGISVNIADPEEMKSAVKHAENFGSQVLLEQYVNGEDLRVVVIDYKMVAAAIRKPPEINGNGRSKIIELIEKQSRRRQAATYGESSIPVDGVTVRTVVQQGYRMEDILPRGTTLRVRETANLHTGGTIHDVTGKLSQVLRNVAEKAARILNIPVVGIDMMVPDIKGSEYTIIEANERVGLANHEPQPTAEKFIDFLFPQTKRI